MRKQLSLPTLTTSYLDDIQLYLNHKETILNILWHAESSISKQPLYAFKNSTPSTHKEKEQLLLFRLSQKNLLYNLQSLDYPHPFKNPYIPISFQTTHPTY